MVGYTYLLSSLDWSESIFSSSLSSLSLRFLEGRINAITKTTINNKIKMKKNNCINMSPIWNPLRDTKMKFKLLPPQ